MTSTIERGLEIVPGYTLVRRLGSGMSGEVWVARASGGVHVAIKLIKDLNLVGSRRELGALRVVREVKHPNLCPLIGVWFLDPKGEVLSNSDTDAILGQESSMVDTSYLQTLDIPASPAYPAGEKHEGNTAETQVWQVNEATPNLTFDEAPSNHSFPGPPRDKNALSAVNESLLKKASAMVIAMGLGEKTLHDRLVEMRAPGNQPAPGADPIDQIPGGIEVHELLRYITASASAIDELNLKYKIYHCDIKPQNILVVGGQAQVCDFGLAREVPDSRQTMLAIGTPAYGAPEMMFDHRYSRTIDQYSLAVTYYELRTSQLPFETNRRSSFLRLKATGELDFSRVTPPEQVVIARATQLDPELRYNTCMDFAEALIEAISLAKKKEDPKRSLAKIWVPAACVILASSLAPAAWWWTTQQQTPPDPVPKPIPIEIPRTNLSIARIEPEADVIPPKEATRPDPLSTGPIKQTQPEMEPEPPQLKPSREEPPKPSLPSPVRLIIDRDVSQPNHVQLASIADSIASWLPDPQASADDSSFEDLFNALEGLIPLPPVFAKPTAPETIPSSTQTELVNVIAGLRPHLDKLDVPKLTDRWWLTRLNLDALSTKHDRKIADEVRQRLDSNESTWTKRQSESAVTCLLAASLTENAGDWRNSQSDLQRASKVFENNPATLPLLAQRWVLQLSQLQAYRSAKSSSIAPEDVASIDQLIAQWFEPMSLDLRTQTAMRLLESLRRDSGVADDDTKSLRYRDSTKRAETVIDLCDRLLPAGSEPERLVDAERFLVSIAKSDIPGVARSLKSMSKAKDWTPQIRHALTQLVRSVVKVKRSGVIDAPKELPHDVLAELALPMWRKQLNNNGLPSKTGDDGDLAFFGELVFQFSTDPKLIGESGTTLMEAYLRENRESLERWETEAILQSFGHWQNDKAGEPWSLLLAGRYDDFHGVFALTDQEREQRYENAELLYGEAIDHKETPADLKGSVLRLRADLKLRRALMAEGKSRHPILESALTDSQAAIDLPNRWWKDSDERLETAADVLRGKLAESQETTLEEKASLLDSFDTLCAQAIEDRQQQGDDTLTLVAKRMDGHWMDMMVNRIDDFDRYQDRRKEAFQLLESREKTGTMKIGNAEVESSAETNSDFARCQWHRSRAKIMELVERYDEALQHEQFAAAIAAERLKNNRPLLHTTILETVVLRGRAVSDAADTKNQGLIEELIQRLSSITDSTAEISRQRDRLLAELNKLRR